MTTRTKEAIALAIRYLEAGLSILPIKPGTKSPDTRLLPKTWDDTAGKYKNSWKPYQEYRATPTDLEKWGGDWGIGIIGGAISGGLLIIDFESGEAFEQWHTYALMVVDAAILQSLPVVETGKGRHIYLRCEEPGGNRKLATHGKETLIETRGEGGYVLAPPTIHPSGKTYTTVQGDLTNIPHIPMVHVHALLDAARAVSPPAFPLSKGKTPQNGTANVIDTFNTKFSLEDILTQYGYTKGGNNRFIRPGGEKSSVIVTEGRSVHFNSNDLLYKEAPGGGYYSHDAFSAWCCLAHGGVVKTAVKAAAQELGISGSKPQEHIMLKGHPTGADEEPVTLAVQLPHGYRLENGSIKSGDTMLYLGQIYVTETGTNIHTGEETAIVQWDTGETVISRTDLASANGCTRVLGGAGAAIHAMNAKYLSRFLVEFIQVNREVIPHTLHVDRYGIAKDALILPGGMIGIPPAQVRYTSKTIDVGDDTRAYYHALHQAKTWGNTPVFWAVLALALASPIYARLKPDRNPVIHLGGTSGVGKTTLAHFAIGCYGDPTRSPLQVQCGSESTTPKGMSQALVMANGLPTFFEDIHMMLEREPRRVAGIIYDFANGQNRTYGTIDQRTGGGQEMHGSLFLAGEISMEFTHAGSNNRVFSLDCSRFYPLGAAAKSQVGVERGALLNKAMQKGKGTLGVAVCAHIWANWQDFLAMVRAIELSPTLAPFQAWRRLLAVAAAVLEVVDTLVGLELDMETMLEAWGSLYHVGHQSRDPAEVAFERVRMLLLQSSYLNNKTHNAHPSWHYLTYENKLVAVRREGDDFWRVMTTTPEWIKHVGQHAVEKFGGLWKERGWIEPHKNGNLSHSTYVGKGSTPYCILVTEEGFGASES